MKKLLVVGIVLLCFMTVITGGCSSHKSNSSTSSDSVTGATSEPDHITLTWNSDPQSTQTITWRTDTTVNSGKVECKSDNSEVKNSEVVKPVAFQTNLGAVNLFTITLTGLTSGTKYNYRVGDGTKWSQWSTFTTESSNDSSFKFLVFGDSQSGGGSDYQPWEKTLHNAYNANQDAKYFMNMGDQVECGQDYYHWTKWFAAAKGVIDHIPDMPVQGNHDTFLPHSDKTDKPIFWITQFALPQNGPAELKTQVYSFDYGSVHFSVLDSQQDEELKYGDIIEIQKQWLEKDLAATKKAWKVVLFHKTPYYNRGNRSHEELKEAFCPILDKYNVDVVFNGHDHAVARTYFINNNKFFAKPSQGTLYYVCGRSGNKTYLDLSQKEWNSFFYDPQDQPNYLVVKVDDKKINIKAVKQDGTIIDDFTIDKFNDTASPALIIPH